MCAEEGGSILIFDRDVVRCELILRPIASRLGAANEFGHANGKVLRAETRLATNTKACVVDLVTWICLEDISPVSATETMVQDFRELGQVPKWDIRASEVAET